MELGKRREQLPCELLMSNSYRSWKSQGKGEASIGRMSGQCFVLFSNEDGTELCWRIEETKRFTYEGKCRIQFYCDAERLGRAFAFQEQEEAEQFWGRIQVALQVEPEEDHVTFVSQEGARDTPTSNMSTMYQALTLTSIDAMSGTHFGTQNLDTILWMIKDRPDAVHELLMTDGQFGSLDRTYQEISRALLKGTAERNGTPATVLIQKLVEVVRAIRRLYFYEVSGLNSSTIQCLLGGDCWRLTFKILSHDPVLSSRPLESSDLDALATQSLEYKRICKVTNNEIVDKISLNFKLLYLRDCIFDRTIDERAVRDLTAMIHVNYIEILIHILSTPTSANSLVQGMRRLEQTALQIFKEVTDLLRQPDPMIVTSVVPARLMQLLRDHFGRFIKDYRILSLMESLVSSGGTRLIVEGSNPTATSSEVFNNPNADNELIAIEILTSLVTSSPWLLWEHFLSDRQKDQDYKFLRFMFEQLEVHPSSERAEMISEFLGLLLIPRMLVFTYPEQSATRRSFISVLNKIIYPKCISGLEAGAKRPLYLLRFLQEITRCLGGELPAGHLPALLQCLVKVVSSHCDKNSAHMALAIFTHLIATVSTNLQEVLVPALVSLTHHFARSPTRGMLLSQLGRAFHHLCRRGMSEAIRGLLAEARQQFTRPKMSGLASCLFAYENRIHAGDSPQEIVRDWDRPTIKSRRPSQVRFERLSPEPLLT